MELSIDQYIEVDAKTSLAYFIGPLSIGLSKKAGRGPTIHSKKVFTKRQKMNKAQFVSCNNIYRIKA